MRRLATTAVLAVLVVLLAGCGGTTVVREPTIVVTAGEPVILTA